MNSDYFFWMNSEVEIFLFFNGESYVHKTELNKLFTNAKMYTNSGSYTNKHKPYVHYDIAEREVEETE
jgi:hypothetical protein